MVSDIANHSYAVTVQDLAQQVGPLNRLQGSIQVSANHWHEPGPTSPVTSVSFKSVSILQSRHTYSISRM